MRSVCCPPSQRRGQWPVPRSLNKHSNSFRSQQPLKMIIAAFFRPSTPHPTRRLETVAPGFFSCKNGTVCLLRSCFYELLTFCGTDILSTAKKTTLCHFSRDERPTALHRQVAFASSTAALLPTRRRCSLGMPSSCNLCVFKADRLLLTASRRARPLPIINTELRAPPHTVNDHIMSSSLLFRFPGRYTTHFSRPRRTA